MDSNIILLYGIILVMGVNFKGTESHKSECDNAEFWNSDADQCLPCSTCIQFPKTPSCDTCMGNGEASNAWKLAAIISFSVLAVVIFSGVLLASILVYQYRSRTRPLREPIEETTGPLYQV